jgi:uncharacterized protein
MLRNTFCHIPGIKLKSEQKLWSHGILDWEAALRNMNRLPSVNSAFLRKGILESIERLGVGDSDFFCRKLPPAEQWRVFPEFSDSVAYLDIETSGLRDDNYITTIAMYDGHNVFHYVTGDNLGDFVRDIQKYSVIVTYNGRCFDVPFIEKSFGIKLPQGHIDLRWVMKSLGLKGGLKGCERSLGLDRRELDGVDGYFAVLLWNDYCHNGNDKALQTLLAYNVLDAVNLERLLAMAYNLKLAETPFLASHQLRIPEPLRNPFRPDMDTVYRIADQYGLSMNV